MAAGRGGAKENNCRRRGMRNGPRRLLARGLAQGPYLREGCFGGQNAVDSGRNPTRRKQTEPAAPAREGPCRRCGLGANNLTPSIRRVAVVLRVRVLAGDEVGLRPLGPRRWLALVELLAPLRVRLARHA